MKHLFLAVFIIVLLAFFSCNRNKKATRIISYKGVITKIYRDNSNHGMFTFDIIDGQYKSFVLAEKWPRSWEYAEVGDSVIKPPDTLMLIIKKPNGEEKHFNYDW